MPTTPVLRRVDAGLVAGFGVLAALTTVSVWAGLQLTTAMVAAPIVASILTTAQRTAVVAVCAIALSVLGGTWLGLPYTGGYFFRVGICAGLSILAVLSALSRDRRERRLQRITVIAETAQRAILGAMPTAIGSVGLAARYVSAAAEAQVGGDLYEVAETPYGVRVIIGDVRGKGLAAVHTAATVLGVFRTAAFTEPDPGALARHIDDAMSRVLDDEEFVTAVVGEFRDGRVTLANCGHHPPLLVRHAEAAEVCTGEPTLPLGLGSDPEVSEHDWPAGARMLFYTDGLVEARDESGEFFPLEQHAAELADGGLQDALDVLVQRLLAYTGEGMDDDLALVLAESRPE